MKKDLQEELFNIEPAFFTRDDMRASAMAFGFECGDGWFPLVKALIVSAKWKKAQPKYVPNEEVEGSFRESLDCVADTREGFLTQPDRVVRDHTDLGCPFTTDSYNARDFLCVGGFAVAKKDLPTTEVIDGKTVPTLASFSTKKRTSNPNGIGGQCKGCEGTSKFVYYKHTCERPWNHFQVRQVKEKFGGLRFYVDGADREYFGAISFAESLSFSICEACGVWGAKQTKGGWIKTLCDKHTKEETWTNLA